MATKGRRYKIILHFKILNYIAKERYTFVFSILYHECLHIYDIHSIRSNPLYNFNPCSVSHRNSPSFIMDIGFHFWTEFYAYAKTFKYYKDYHEYKTFYQLVKSYKKIQEQSHAIQYISKYEEQVEKLTEVRDEMKGFMYELAKHAAGSIFGKKRNYEYSQKTQNLKEYKYISKKLDVLIKMMLKMSHGTYGKYLFQRLYNIGVYILKSFYFPLSIRLKKVNGTIHFAYLYYTD